MTTDQDMRKEIDYWRGQAELFKKNYESVSAELEEFQESSKDLEQELEMQLERHERLNKELKTTNQRQAYDLENLREKYQELQADSADQLGRLEDELSCACKDRDEAQQLIRELEQVNDDLERAKRALVASLEDFEKKMNETIERNAFLESELDEKDALLVSVQRLKEETRDLKQELTVREKISHQHNFAHHHVPQSSTSSSSGVATKPGESVTPPGPAPAPHPLQHRSSFEHRHGQPTMMPLGLRDKISRSHTVDSVAWAGSEQSPFSPSARISALNIVGDLLRKVGALESKLATCRRYSTDHPLSPAGGSVVIPHQTQGMKPSVTVGNGTIGGAK